MNKYSSIFTKFDDELLLNVIVGEKELTVETENEARLEAKSACTFLSQVVHQDVSYMLRVNGNILGKIG